MSLQFTKHQSLKCFEGRQIVFIEQIICISIISNLIKLERKMYFKYINNNYSIFSDIDGSYYVLVRSLLWICTGQRSDRIK